MTKTVDQRLRGARKRGEWIVITYWLEFVSGEENILEVDNGDDCKTL